MPRRDNPAAQSSAAFMSASVLLGSKRSPGPGEEFTIKANKAPPGDGAKLADAQARTAQADRRKRWFWLLMIKPNTPRSPLRD